MTVNDFFKRISEEDKDKMMIFREGQGWSNINIEVKENEVSIYCDKSILFSSDK